MPASRGAAAFTARNTSSPRNRNNFGQLFTDKANDFQLNQVLATVGRPIPKDATGWEFGFKLQGLFGTDARYTRWAYFGKGQTNRYQGDIVEANVLLHAPEPLGGIDFKVGMYSTPMGAETIDPSTNAFYSHSYIFNFGIPLKHTGALSSSLWWSSGKSSYGSPVASGACLSASS